MFLLNILLIATALGVDAFSIGMAAGACFQKILLKQKLKMTLSFGLLHVIMPILGWLVGVGVADFIEQFDHWVILILLVFVGGKLIHGSLRGANHEEAQADFFSEKNIMLLSVAASIDALAIGISFALLQETIIFPAVIIGLVVAIMTWISITLGRKIGEKVSQKMQIIAGIVLILIGVRIFLEHYGVINSLDFFSFFK